MTIVRFCNAAAVTVWISYACLLQGCDAPNPTGPDQPDPYEWGPRAAVIDQHTLKGIAGVRVEIEGIGVFVTDRQGMYTVPRTVVHPGRHSVRLRAEIEGFLPEAVEASFKGDNLRIPHSTADSARSSCRHGPGGGHNLHRRRSDR